MHQLYKDILLGLDDVVYARLQAYSDLSHLDELSEDYTPIHMIDDQPIPPLRDSTSRRDNSSYSS